MADIPGIFFGEKAQVIIAGAAGGVVRWLTLRQNWKDGMVAIVVGALCATYLSPLVFPILDPVLKVAIEDFIQRATFAGFFVGVGGVGITGFILDIVSSMRKGKNDDKNS